MGISGLLPLLKSIQKPCSLKKFSGQTIGIDAYGWLHRGTVACAIDLALGKPTRKHIEFSMHRVRMLIHFGVIPYLVFDGDYLPSKAVTEVERAQRREESKRRGLELYNLNKPSQAHLELQKAVDVTPAMARELIEELKKIGVQYVVAPYEADAQLVYLERKGVIHGMISEDSDLLVFGAKCLLTKLDQYGECVELNRADFTACREISLVGWSDAEFRRMAILSGCDYLTNINRMGLKTAYRLVRKYKTIDKILRILQFDGQYSVPAGYLEAFQRAELTFLHQRVFCPLQNDVVMMTEIEGVQPEDLSFIGGEVEQAVAIGVSTGHLDPMTKAPIIVPANSKSTPRTPWTNTRKNITTTFCDMKENQSITSFFEVKRTPLAELDVNTFTPSPTQERLLHEASRASWESSPAPSTLNHVNSPVASAVPHAALANPRANTVPKDPRTGAPWMKRRRLCLGTDDTEETYSVEGSNAVRSHFFMSNAGDSTPTSKVQKRSHKARKKEINVWSDDSVEDVMAELPDVSKAPVPRNKGKLEVFRDDQVKAMEHLKDPTPKEEEPRQDDSQTSTSSRGSTRSTASTDTSTTSVSSSAPTVAQILDKSVSTELAALTQKFSYNPGKESIASPLITTAVDRKPSKNTVLNLPTTNPPPTKQKPMTPLQRLGVGALNRSKSHTGLLPHSPLNPKQTTSNDSLPSQTATTPARHIPTLPFHRSDGPDASNIKGSEDAMVPDSEDEISDAMTEVEETKPVLDLERFAFSG